MCDMDQGLIELFVDGKEDGLPDSGWVWGRVKDQTGDQLVMSGSPMTGAPLLGGGADMGWRLLCINVGALQPALDNDLPRNLPRHKEHFNTNDAYYIYGGNGTLYGNGKQDAARQGKFAKGDRIGVLLDLDTAGCASIATTSGVGLASRRA